MGNNQGDGKFGFSDQTRVDTGRGPTAAAGPDDDDDDPVEKTAAMSLADLGLDLDDEDDDEPVEKTTALSLDELRAAGAFDDDAPASDPAPAPAPAPAAPRVEKTAAMSLDEMLGQGAGGGGGAPAPPVEKTAAMSLDDMLGQGAGGGGGAPAAPRVEKTAAMSLDDMLGQGGGGGGGAPAPPVEKTAAMSLDEMLGQGAGGGGGEPPVEKTAAMSLAEMQGASGAAPAEKTAAMSLSDMMGAPAPEAPPPKLVVTDGNDQGTEFELTDDDILVGRGLDCGVVLGDASVSRKHFRLVRIATGYRLVDLGSGNGTKVDGQRVAELEMKTGMQISVGTTVLVWRQAEPVLRPPTAGSRKFADFGEGDDATRVSDLAALELLPDWADREGAPPADGTATMAVAQPQQSSGSGVPKVIVLVLTLILVLGGGFVALDAVAGLGVIFTTGPDPEELAKRKEEVKKAAEARELMGEGKEAFQEQKWHSARKKFSKALAIDKDIKGGQDGMLLAQSEIQAMKIVEDADKDLEDGSNLAALTKLKKVADSSFYYPNAVEMLKAAREAYITEKVTEARELEEAGNVAGALAAVQAALEESPEDMDALAFADELKRAHGEALADAGGSGGDTAGGGSAGGGDAKAGGSAGGGNTASAGGSAGGGGTAKSGGSKSSGGGTAKSGGSKSSGGGSTAKSGGGSSAKSGGSKSSGGGSAKSGKSTKSTKSGKSSGGKKAAKGSEAFSEALSKYSSGDFAGAKAAFDALSSGRGKKRDKSKAKRLSSAVGNFQTAWGAGIAAAKAFKTSKAISELSKARKIDSSISGAYQGRIKKELAKMHSYVAATANAKGDFGTAGKHARKALALDGSQAAAKAIYTDVQGKAQTWLEQAKKAAKSNPDKAMQLLSKVLAVFPRDDSRYTEAYTLLNELGSEEDDE